MRSRFFALAAALLVATATLSMSVTAGCAELPDFTGLAKEAGPAVVNINTVKIIQPKAGQRMQQLPPGHGAPFEEFFREFFERFGRRDLRPRKQRSLGSGFIISPDGFVVTNHHVIAQASEISVNLQGREESIKAEVVGSDPATDLALLKIDNGSRLPTLEFGDSEDLDVGDWVVAIGNPFGLSHTLTAGIVSAKGRIIGAGPFDNFIQTDASINPGNSGGPLIDADGEVVGINTAIVAAGQGIGFAVPASMAEGVIDQLRSKGRVSRGWLGVTIQNIDEDLARGLGLDEPRGVLVAEARDGEPAAGAGIESGDVILEVDGDVVDEAAELTRVVASKDPGDTIELTLWRDGDTREVEVRLGERDLESEQAQAAPGQVPEEQEQGLGISVRPLASEEARQLGMDRPRGLVVVQVAPGSPAAVNGLRPGDVILEAGREDVDGVEDLRRIIRDRAEDPGVLLLKVLRQGQTIYRSVPLG
jgi:serine protease Do